MQRESSLWWPQEGYVEAQRQVAQLTDCRGYEHFKAYPGTECRYCENRQELERKDA